MPDEFPGRIPDSAEPRQGPDALPALALAAAKRFGLPAEHLVPLGGATGQVYAAAGRVLRLGAPGTIDIEAAAAARAAAVVPVPRILERYDHELGSAVLMILVPGSVAWQPGAYDPERARRRGLACGAAQLALATLTAPPLLASSDAKAGRTAEATLLHLDLHPLNILLDDDDHVTAVLDWANASAGPADYDRARTATILRFDPATGPLRHDPSWRAFTAGWTEGARLEEVSAESMAWACRFMLNDLDGRHPAAALDDIRAALLAVKA